MISEWTGEGRTADDAVARGLARLGLRREDVHIHVLGERSSGLLSLFGFRRTQVRLVDKRPERTFEGRRGERVDRPGRDRQREGGRIASDRGAGQNRSDRGPSSETARTGGGPQDRNSRRAGRDRFDRGRADASGVTGDAYSERGRRNRDNRRNPSRTDEGRARSSNRPGEGQLRISGSAARISGSAAPSAGSSAIGPNVADSVRDPGAESSKELSGPWLADRPRNSVEGAATGRRNDRSRPEGGRPPEQRRGDASPRRDARPPLRRDGRRRTPETPGTGGGPETFRPHIPPESLLAQWREALGWEDLAWEIGAAQNRRLPVTLRTSRGERLAGRGGKSLEAFEHIFNLISSGGDRERPWVSFQVEGFPTSDEHRAVDQALFAAFQARRTGRPFRLDPMPPAQRRLVHQTLANHPDVETVSEGEGAARKVVVKLRTPGASSSPPLSPPDAEPAPNMSGTTSFPEEQPPAPSSPA